ncbi:MAG TPA: hypothetical protein VM253_01150 [Candidatus Limnocylindrales bacterium]|nr:hypothetical protein [Candidatus Limnocylindrales bacterium]
MTLTHHRELLSTHQVGIQDEGSAHMVKREQPQRFDRLLRAFPDAQQHR